MLQGRASLQFPTHAPGPQRARKSSDGWKFFYRAARAGCRFTHGGSFAIQKANSNAGLPGATDLKSSRWPIILRWFVKSLAGGSHLRGKPASFLGVEKLSANWSGTKGKNSCRTTRRLLSLFSIGTLWAPTISHKSRKLKPENGPPAWLSISLP